MQRMIMAVIVVAVLAVSLAGQDGGRQVPTFEPDPLWSKALPNKWMTGAVGGLAVDSHDHLWVFQRPGSIPDSDKAASLNPPQAECCIPAPAVLEFDTNGKLLQAWGGPGQGYEWFRREHAIFVDDEDNVWLSGSAKEDNHILKFSNKGSFLMQIGRSGKNTGSNDTQNLGAPAGLFLYEKTNELFVADGYSNHRVIVFDARTGAYKRHWGAYGKPPDDSLVFPPRAQLIQGPAPQGFNNPVHAVLVTNDDLVYVGDRANNRLQVFRLDGTFVREIFIARNTLHSVGTVQAFTVSPDNDQQFLYVLDHPNRAIRVLNRSTLELIASIGGHAGHNTREFSGLHSIVTDSNGNLFIGEAGNGMRYYKYVFRGLAPVH